MALGRELRDTLPLPRNRYEINPHWARILKDRETSMAQQNDTIKSNYDEHAKELSELCKGDLVLCQNTRTKKWDRSGEIVEVGKFRQYMVKMDGSGRISQRNRRHLQKIHKASTEIPHIPTHNPLPSTPPTVGDRRDNPGQAENPATIADQADSVVQPDAHYVRRSERFRTQPDWYRAENYA